MYSHAAVKGVCDYLCSLSPLTQSSHDSRTENCRLSLPTKQVESLTILMSQGSGMQIITAGWVPA